MWRLSNRAKLSGFFRHLKTLRHKRKRHILFLIFYLFSFYAECFGQIHGVVIDGYSQETLPGATVVSNDKQQVVADNAGRFIIEESPELNWVYASHIGYSGDTIYLNKQPGQIAFLLVPEPYNLEEVMISPRLFPQKLKFSAGNISILSHMDLKSIGNSDLSFYLNTVPGVYMHQGARNTARLTIRGIGSRSPYATNRIRAFFGSVPLTNGEGFTTLEDIDLSDIGTVELLKGPHSAEFGPGMGGVIKIIPRVPHKPGFSVKAASEAGSWGYFKNNVNLDFRNPQLWMTSSFNYNESKGYRENSEYKRYGGVLSGQYFQDNHFLSFVGLGVNVRANIPSSIDKNTFENDPGQAAEGWADIKGYEEYDKYLAGLTWRADITPSLINALAVFGGYNQKFELRPFNALSDDALNFGFRQKLSYSGSLLQVVLATEWYRENYRWSIYPANRLNAGDPLNENRESRSYYGVRLALSKEIKPFTFTTGLSLAKVNYHLEDLFLSDGQDQSGSYAYPQILSPMAGINVEISPEIYLYANVGHGFSTPTVEETLLPEGNINPDLKPEDGIHAEIGSRMMLFEKKLHAEINTYTIFSRNLLVTKRYAEDIFTAINAGKTRHSGVETSLKFHVFDPSRQSGKRLDLMMSFDFSVHRFIEFTDDGNDYSGNQLPGLPASFFNAMVYFRNPRGLGFNLDFRHFGEQFMNDANSETYKAYALLNAKISLEKPLLKKWKIECFSIAKNLLNEKYASMILVNAPSFNNSLPRYYYPGLPRNGSLGFIIVF